MGTLGIKIKLMPLSPEIDLEEIKKESQSFIEQKGGKNCRFEEEPVAFGLKAIIAYFELPEEQELEEIEDGLKKVKNVNSIQIIDMRRLLG